jgi:hypothetical protein
VKIRLIVAGWFISNFVAIWCYGFTDDIVLRVIGGVWLGAGLSMSGLITLGGLFPSKSP